MNGRDKIAVSFQERLDELLQHHKELMLAIHNKRNEASLQNELVIQLVLQSAVLWESYLSDILLAYVEMSPSRSLLSLKERVSRSVEAKFGKKVRQAIAFELPARPSCIALAKLLDPKGWNITSATAKQLSTKANDLLLSPYAQKFSLDAADSQFFDYLFCLRNFLSHYSDGSRSELQVAVKALSDPKNKPLNGTLGKIGNYLKHEGMPGSTRAVFVVQRIIEISKKL